MCELAAVLAEVQGAISVCALAMLDALGTVKLSGAARVSADGMVVVSNLIATVDGTVSVNDEEGAGVISRDNDSSAAPTSSSVVTMVVVRSKVKLHA
mmetsp:Transcript_25115/g.52520  ORF Transcript_25115/g.52520 Transcript_25115/m.52520 type:complete len:97 (+) Transcript_25115:90-380(+)